MRIFITGGTGFIGKYLVKNLQEKGHKLLLLSESEEIGIFNTSENIEILKGGLSDVGKWINAVKDFNPDAAIHLAWQGIPDYGPEMSAKNLNYGISLIDSLSKIGCKWILAAGSCWEYGGRSGKISEDMPANPMNDFTKAKDSLRKLGMEMAEKSGFQFVWARFFYVYGPGQKETSLIPYLIKSIKDGEIPEIKNPDAKNDFIYVEDLAEALSMLAEKQPASGIYNIGSGVLTSVRDIIAIIYENLKADNKIKNAKPGSTDVFSDFWADIGKIEKETGWHPGTDVKDGIIKLIDYYS